MRNDQKLNEEKALSNEIADSGFPTEKTPAATIVPKGFSVTRSLMFGFGKYHRSKKLQKRIDQALVDTPFRP